MELHVVTELVVSEGAETLYLRGVFADRAKAEEFGDGLADGRDADCTTVFITTVREGEPTSVYLMGDIE